MNYKNLFAANAYGDMLALLAGMLTTLAFAPFQLFPLGILAPALLLAATLYVSAARAFLRGFYYGAGFFGTGVYWVFISIHTFGNTPIPLSLGITGGFIAIFALFPAFNMYWLQRFFPALNTTKIILAFPALWVFLEWMRSLLFTGFPWLFLGYSQIHSPLKGFAPLLSVYGVSFVTLICSGLLVHIIVRFNRNEMKHVYLSLAYLALLWMGGSLFSFISWTSPFEKPIQVSLVQGNIPQEIKWNPDAAQLSIEHYLTLTQPFWSSNLIVWPEAAIPVPAQSAENLLNTLDENAKKHHVSFITGIPIKKTDEDAYYNALLQLGSQKGFYLKHRLVPFGEYIPFHHSLDRLFDLLNVPMSSFVPGTTYDGPLEIGKIKIASFICYEIAYPEMVKIDDNNINMLLTVSNDAWFGKSIAQAQHLEMAAMRALELGRPLLFASNNGITATILPNGDIQAKAPPFESTVLTAIVQPMRGKTPWQQRGMDPLLITIFSLLVHAVRMRKKSFQ